jgi:hypothetical protein
MRPQQGAHPLLLRHQPREGRIRVLLRACGARRARRVSARATTRPQQVDDSARRRARTSAASALAAAGAGSTTLAGDEEAMFSQSPKSRRIDAMR